MTTDCEPWPILGYTAPDGTDPDILAAAIEAAQMFLNGVSRGRIGVCTYTQRFQVRETVGVCGLPYNTSTGLPHPASTCCSIKLPNTPIQTIVSVEVDGVALLPSAYVVLSGTRLARLGGCWPQSGDCEPGRVIVSYNAGFPLTPGSDFYGMAGAAMGEMVREYMTAFTGGTCKLPSRFVMVARQGVTTTALDPALFLQLGLTGLPLTDNFIRTVNPNGLRRKPRVVSIDGPRQR